ncbi:ABC transporter ATP-binding protein [Micromonospora sp. NPDC005324]|uniref:ABC transporter ATP-binding protein n=1 Tax=Micromonospora sp. NPDC005324 TaxID=3157033 RepID=UPI0033BF8F9C
MSTGATTTARTPRLRATGVTLGYGDRTVVDALDLDVLDGGVTAVIGPNGCGKSTLLRALGRLLAPSAGAVLLDGRRIDRLPSREVARELGLLPQAPVAPEGLTVADLVARGRHPHRSLLRQWSRDDEAAVTEALAWTGVADLAERPVDELSGGQRQRVWLSMALAQGTDVLLLDEPTTYLDVAHAIEVLDLVDRLHADRGRTVVMVLHDLTLAARYADQLVVMSQGRIAAAGEPTEVLTADVVREVFGIRASVVPDPVSGRPLVLPIGTRHVHPHLIEPAANLTTGGGRA